MMYIETDDEMEMPCICQQCGKVFDLNDGVGFESIVYCQPCGEAMLDQQSLIDNLHNAELDLSDAEDDAIEVQLRVAQCKELVRKFKTKLNIES